MCFMHCLTKFSGVSSKYDENLPFKLLVTAKVHFQNWKNEYGFRTAIYLLL
jgi:hypothetical protein